MEEIIILLIKHGDYATYVGVFFYVLFKSPSWYYSVKKSRREDILEEKLLEKQLKDLKKNDN